MTELDQVNVLLQSSGYQIAHYLDVPYDLQYQVQAVDKNRGKIVSRTTLECFSSLSDAVDWIAMQIRHRPQTGIID
jgi:hypothetical protein